MVEIMKKWEAGGYETYDDYLADIKLLRDDVA